MPERGAVADLGVLVALLGVAHRHQIRVPGHAHVVEHVRDGGAPQPPEAQVAIPVEPLVLDDDDAVVVERAGQGAHEGVVDARAQVDASDLGPEHGIEGGDGHHCGLRREDRDPAMHVTPGDETRQGRRDSTIRTTVPR